MLEGSAVKEVGFMNPNYTRDRLPDERYKPAKKTKTANSLGREDQNFQTYEQPRKPTKTASEV